MEPLLIDEPFALLISGQPPYENDKALQQVWFQQLDEDIDRVMKVAAGLLKDRYPMLNVEIH